MTTNENSPADYTVRRLTPADAAGIPELTNRVNGPAYIHAEVYHPEQLIRLNESGHLVSIVALHATGTVVGHYALERPDLGPVAETGEAMVLPEHQHHHLLDRMRTVLEAEAHNIGLAGVFGNAVTHHVFSQRTEERFQAHPTGIMLAASPAAAHRIEGGYPQRVSLLNYFKFLRHPGDAIAHLPDHHRAIASRIFERLDKRVQFGTPQTLSGPGQLTSSYEPHSQQGSIKVREPGFDSAGQIEEARHGLFGNFGAEVVYLELPLNRPGSADLCIAAERLGFFFSGISPAGAEGGDAVRLQSPKNPLDLSLLQIESEFARELLAYVGRERARVKT
jgi:hypothetical protein